jgi:hypothetical protein
MSIKRVTHGLRQLASPPNVPAGEVWRYGFGCPFQVGPVQAAILVNIHRKGARTHDYEMGTDAVVFESLAGIVPANAVVVCRNHRETNPRTSEMADMVKYTTIGGFVPLGAKRPDGSPHPHAGTGFGADFALAHPIDDGNPAKPYPGVYRGAQEYAFWEFHQFAFDGASFRVTHTERLPADTAWSGQVLFSGPLPAAIPDGDDLLLSFTVFRPGAESRGFVTSPGTMVSGVSRWRREQGRWRPMSFAPVTGTIDSFEPSLVRDIDGSLLFSARPGADPNHSHSVLVWRSRDSGVSWQKILEIPHLRQASPVTLNTAVDGTPYLLCNQSLSAFMFRPGQIFDGHDNGAFREIVALWPLDESRTGLLSPLILRCPRYEFGVPPDGGDWACDHANGNTVRLADGQWRHLVAHRLLAHGEVTSSLPPVAQSGLWLEQLDSDGDLRNEWRF